MLVSTSPLSTTPTKSHEEPCARSASNSPTTTMDVPLMMMMQPEDSSPSPPSSNSQLTTCIVGGGSAAHVIIPLLHESHHRIHLLTRRPDDWSDVVRVDTADAVTGQVTAVHTGQIHKKSSDPAHVIPGADIIILCMPVHQYRPALDRIGPFVNRHKQVFVGTVYGQAGFNWMVHSMERDNGLDNVVAFAIGQIPWISRTLKYGRMAVNYGPKKVNVAAVTPTDKFEELNRILFNGLSFVPFKQGLFDQADEFLSITLSVDNQILHPSRCYGLWVGSGTDGIWESEDKIPYFYRDFDERSAENIFKIDAEYTLIRNAIKERYPCRSFKYMLNYLELENLNHSSGRTDILASLRDSEQLAAIRTPSVKQEDGRWALDLNCRFFTDDIPYGLLVAKWIAEQLGVATPFIDEIIQWAQKLRGEDFLTPNNKVNLDYCLKEKYRSGIPPAYGITSIDEIFE